MKKKDIIILIVAILPLVSLIMQWLQLSIVSHYQGFFSIFNVVCIIITLIYASILLFQYKGKTTVQKMIIGLSVVYLFIILIIAIGIIVNRL